MNTIQRFKKIVHEHFFRPESIFQPIDFWRRFPFYQLPSLVFQRAIIYTLLGRKNRILSVRFPGIKGVRMLSHTAFLGGLRYFGWWENEIRNIFRTYIPRAHSFIEIGAMEGFYEIIAHKLNPDATIMAVEPEKGAYEAIRKNFLLNDMDFGGRIKFCSKFISNNSEFNNMTIGELIQNLESPLFIAMDIDGGEEKALRGGIDAIRNIPTYFEIETHSPQLEASCKSILEDAGFTVRIIKNAWWRHFWPEERPAPQHGAHHNRWIFATNITISRT